MRNDKNVSLINPRRQNIFSMKEPRRLFPFLKGDSTRKSHSMLRLPFLLTLKTLGGNDPDAVLKAISPQSPVCSCLVKGMSTNKSM